MLANCLDRKTVILTAVLAACAGNIGNAAAIAAPVEIDARPSHARILAGERQRIYVRIGLKSPQPTRAKDRPPLNIALVIDKSGSMQGRRIAEARRAALMGLSRLGRDDIVSVIAYDSTVATLVPATKVDGSDLIRRKIRSLDAGGSTAIYDGVQTGAREIRKFADDNRISRIILLSDGLANVGPKRPVDFERLGRRLSEDGIIVSTIGLGTGYNEDLMAALARTGEGNHAFVQEPQDLVDFFNKEFDEALGVVATDVEVIIRVRRGIRPIGALGRSAEVSGREIRFRVGQLIGGSEQVLLAELEVPSGMSDDLASLADVEVSYRSATTNVKMRTTSEVPADWTRDRTAHDESADKDVMRDVTLLQARQRREAAIQLRDRGDIKGARKLFKSNAKILSGARERYGFRGRGLYADEERANNKAAAMPASPEAWRVQRKSLRSIQSNKAGASRKY